MPGGSAVKANAPSAPVVALRETALPRVSVPVSAMAWAAMPDSLPSTTPSLSASSQTRPLMTPASGISAKRLSLDVAPGVASAMPLIALGSTACEVAVPPALPATVRPLDVAGGCAGCVSVYVPGRRSATEKRPSAPVTSVRVTAAPRSSVPVSTMLTPLRPRSAGRSCWPLSLASPKTMPLRPTGRISPNRCPPEVAPAASAMPLTVLGVVPGTLAVPPAGPATVRPFSVVTPPTTGCASCCVSV